MERKKNEGLTEEILANMMVGREVMLHANKQPCVCGKVVLSVKHLSVKDVNNILRVDDVTFDIHEGGNSRNSRGSWFWTKRNSGSINGIGYIRNQ